MKAFTYTRATSVDDAIAALGHDRGAKFLGGGTNLVDLMKMGVEQPTELVDITRLPLNTIEEHDGGVRMGAMARNSDAANHPLIRQRYPVLTEALLAGASPQLRNMATMGGNLLQRTRCSYFYDPSFAECNKRSPGSGCAAIRGYNRQHAILGSSEQCIATHPSDMAVAMMALGATISVRGSQGVRRIPIADFYRLPGDTPQFDTVLRHGELIEAIDLPPLNAAARSSYYLKVRDRNSYAFALVSVAAVLDVENGTIRGARLALGGVAHKPWRDPSAEQILVGKPAGREAYAQAAAVLLQAAVPREFNGFKVEMAKRSVIRALEMAQARS